MEKNLHIWKNPCIFIENSEWRIMQKKFFRDTDAGKLGGVCSGLSTYFNIDVTLVRIIFVIALLCGSAGFWAYLLIWLIAPAAKTPEEKCELRGLPPTPENLRKFF